MLDIPPEITTANIKVIVGRREEKG